MEVNNKEMYHFHNNKVYNDKWVPSNEIIVDNNFEADFLKRLEYFSIAVDTIDGKRQAFNSVINNYLKEKQGEETLIRMLKDSMRIIYTCGLFKRELALEEIRKQKYPELPSRKHSIWLCDEQGIDFWQEQISNEGKIEVDLYKVLVTGNLFKSSDLYIPKNYSDYATNLIEAEAYWNPPFAEDEKQEKIEYLFQGKVKILEKVNKK